MNLVDKIEKNEIVLHTARNEFGICIYNDPASDTMSVQFEWELVDVSKTHIVAVQQVPILKIIRTYRELQRRGVIEINNFD